MGQKVYITKFALTTGIVEAELRDDCYGNDRHIMPIGYYNSFKVGTEIFYSKEDAIKGAEKMRIKKIESLKKQIRKLETLKIEVK